MNWFECFKVGIKGLAVHKGRAALSMLGIIFGVGAVVAAVSVSLGAEKEFQKLLAAMGSNTVMVQWTVDKNHPETLQGQGMSRRDVEALSLMAHVTMAAPVQQVGRPRSETVRVRAGVSGADARVIGTTPEYLPLMGFHVGEGRFISHDDDREIRRVCVLEEILATELFPAGGAVGGLVFLEGEPYRVAGVLRHKEATGEKKYEDVVDIKAVNRTMYVPVSCAVQRTTRPRIGGEVNGAVLRVDDSRNLYEVSRQAALLLASGHDLRSQDSASKAAAGGAASPAPMPFKVSIPLELLKQRRESQRLFNVILYVTALCSLVVGGIGIMNIMLANVSERRREIGIRRAVGATERDVRRQFLLEALSICMLGGLAGILLGVALAAVIQIYAGFATAHSPWGIAASFLTAVAVGLVFGTVPAFSAAKLDPIEALRYE